MVFSSRSGCHCQHFFDLFSCGLFATLETLLKNSLVEALQMMEERLQQLRTEYTTYTSRLAIVRQNLLHKLEVNTARGVRLHLILMRSHRIVGNAVPATMARSHEKMIDASLFRHEQFSKLPLIGWSDFITIFHYEILDRLSGKKKQTRKLHVHRCKIGANRIPSIAVRWIWFCRRYRWKKESTHWKDGSTSLRYLHSTLIEWLIWKNPPSATDHSDLFSETGSSVFTGSGTSASDRTGRSSKNRRKLERKKLQLKEGTAFEDLAIVHHLHQLHSSVNNILGTVDFACCWSTKRTRHLRMNSNCETLRWYSQNTMTSLWIFIGFMGKFVRSSFVFFFSSKVRLRLNFWAKIYPFICHFLFFWGCLIKPTFLRQQKTMKGRQKRTPCRLIFWLSFPALDDVGSLLRGGLLILKDWQPLRRLQSQCESLVHFMEAQKKEVWNFNALHQQPDADRVSVRQFLFCMIFDLFPKFYTVLT